ncbi:MAG: hypothetical protein KJZ93_04070 [Caldilineaceae bacterium]|nr:hypothetical protein [Caldilineaceae bacterium]
MNHCIHTCLCAISLLALTACAPIRPTPTTATADRTAGTLPAAVEYDLGEAMLLQERFAEESRFRKMPVRLNGIIAAPIEGNGPYPVVVIFHGNHPGCPIPPGDEVDRWPCDPAVEQPNYRGFAYLVSHLAAQGYVALSININAENTFGFGEPTPGERLKQVVELHLNALATAAAGGNNPFGVELAGRVELDRLVFFGHSRGGEAGYQLAHHDGPLWPTAPERPNGPVAGLLLIAPAIISVELAGSEAPMAIILPACDQDVNDQQGQYFFERARLDPEQQHWVTSVWLEAANHNFFNETLRDEAAVRPARPDCDPLLTADQQRTFLTEYAVDFLTALLSNDPTARDRASTRMGIELQRPAPDELYGYAARVALLSLRADRRPLLIPATADELTTHLAGGRVTNEGLTTFFCEAGYYTPFVKPGSEPCKRANVTIPGNPAMVVLSWSQIGATLRLALPETEGNLSRYTAISLRVAVDPLSALNVTETPQRFSVQLTDRSGQSASVTTRPMEPALRFPVGYVDEEDPIFAGGLFTGRAPMTTIRLQLRDFVGVDSHEISEIALVFDQTATGSLFMGDLELVGAPTKGSGE